MDPVIGTIASGALGALGSAIGGLFGSSSQRSANETNMQIAREQNELNERMFERQLAWNEEQWNRQNAYNEPKAVSERLRRAGINPALAFSSGQGVTPASSLSSPSVNPAAGTQVHPYDPSATILGGVSAIQGSINSYFNNELTRSQTQKNLVESDRTERLTSWEIRRLQEEARKTGIEGDLARTRLEYELAVLQSNIDLQIGNRDVQKEQLENLRLQGRNMDLQNGLLQIEQQYSGQLKSAQLKQLHSTISEIQSQIGLINANKLLTDQQRLHEIERKTGTIIENGMKGIDYNVKNAVKDYTISTAISQASQEGSRAKMLDFEQRNQKSGERLRRLTSAIPFVNGYDQRKW